MTDSSERPLPEEEGIPDYADDTSTAYDDADRPRFRDSPAALPADEPRAVEEYGVTAAEQRHREPLAERLAREEPDIPPGADRPQAPDPSNGAEYGTLEPGAAVGRLVEQDEGARPDEEKELQARPAGGEALSAEEESVHELTRDEQPEPPGGAPPG
jgi:hypothetical protein